MGAVMKPYKIGDRNMVEWTHHGKDCYCEGILNSDGKRDGFHVGYYEKEGITKYWECSYIDGKRDGEHIWYDKNGSIKARRNFKSGEKDGKWISYYENGNKCSDVNYKDGRGNGKWTYYFESGEPSKIEHYDTDRRTGTWQTFNRAGELVKELKFNDRDVIIEEIDGPGTPEPTEQHLDPPSELREVFEGKKVKITELQPPQVEE